jgi:ADP-heptose:LPS heptosyltransferase
MSGIIIAPFSNSDIRDWPIERYAATVGLLMDRLPADERIRIVGTAGQRLRANEVVRSYPSTRVSNECGRLSWSELVAELRMASCIISNNSGVGHLGGFFGVPTVCVFGGSHQRHEWRPLGKSVILVTRAIGCSPCQRDHGQLSPYDKACLREISPSVVADAALAIMERVRGAANDGISPDNNLGRVA